ncbi:MAG: SurA N-terminal domain-containing protein [Desulfuromonadaceae bacterium]|nr:SurA N-terminal domain-containing protein [Desulfuromonadaceae bacterium]MDD5104777.1 SurA N-terminal domain-containing protein [Desulfuromonadaceae bacterium]
MLSIIRKQKESIIIKIVFVLIVLSFVGTIFLVWGRGSDGMGGGKGGYAATVNGTRISLEEYQSAYQRIRNMYQQIYGQSIPPEMEKTLGLKKVALDGLIDNLLAMKEARSLGIKASKDDVAAAIEAMPMFQKDGKFNFDQYQQLLRSNRMTAKDYEEGQEAEVILKKVRQTIKDKVVVSDADALTQFKKENDKLELEYVAYAPSDIIAEVKLSDADLNDYLQKNANDFKTAEKVALSYVLLDSSSLTANTTVSEDEIQTYYQKNIDRWQSKDGILPLTEVKEKVKAEALKQKGAKQAYELAADTLYKNIKSGDLNLIAQTLKQKVQETPLFTANAPAASLAGEAAVIKKALELKEGEIGGPVETSKGIYILKAKERKASTVPPLAQIKGAVEEKAKAAKAIELAKTKAEDAAKQLAAKATLKTQSTGSFGYSAKGDIPAVGASPEIVEAVFKLSAGQAPGTPFKFGNRWLAVRVKNRTEAPKAQFDATKEELKKSMLPKKQEDAVIEWVKGLREKAKIEINQAIISDK